MLRLVRYGSVADVRAAVDFVGFVPEADMALGPKLLASEDRLAHRAFQQSLVERRFCHEYASRLLL
jgi:hypothetical protein